MVAALTTLRVATAQAARVLADEQRDLAARADHACARLVAALETTAVHGTAGADPTAPTARAHRAAGDSAGSAR